ncbi:hypothetical protein HYR99_40255 [Candidatus Poribacteria bacterium]|nr:hypothetical protein [Candidatus Poribacteria bacterium]
MRKLSVLFILIMLTGSFISCGGDEKDDEKKPTTDGVVTVKVEEIVGTYELVSFFNKDEENTLVIGSAEAGDLKHTRIIKADNTYSVTETEKGNTYTESGAFVLKDNQITFEIKQSSDAKSVNVKNTYAVQVEPGKLTLTLRDSTDELFKEDIGNILTYKKI